ncbi:RagB/SusD family nutrient uptake outer membrane protein [Parabacteroides goldsteinii]|nr:MULTISPECIES: RagB/SusD family nutrient uptake outer membrane protein [Parabacteroides]RKU72965.1 RagB/SusD family nutrient uptake outer membrane protein [Parabacteroides sp. AF17-3]UBD74148.1 RagB/SusD family nutrient uptake outer membrane protein [Parabacteroides goldsteinii]
MNKLLYILSLSLTTTAFLPSCTNLESEMYDVINPNIFPVNENDANALVTAAAYAPFRSSWYSGLFTAANGGIHVIGEMTTDIGYCQWNDVYWPDLLEVNFTPSSDCPTKIYKDYINYIGKMTLALDRISNIEMKDEAKKRLEAEVLCGRGWLAYILYDFYGPIQIPTLEQLNNPLGEIIISRVSKEDMVAFIENDLKAAIEVLPATYKSSDSNYGRFTRGLAYTVLMKLYMHENNWAKAEECGRELMKPEYGYGLMNNYKDIFTLENEGNIETIWAAICSSSVNQQLWQAHVLSSQYPTKNESIQKWGGYRVLWDFYETFDKNDKRLEVLVGEFVGTDGKLYNKENPGTVLQTGAMPVKYGEDPAATGEESQIDWIVYRYADVITLLSEAIVRNSNAVTQEAVSLLNMVRSRAGISTYNLSDIKGVDDFLEKVLEERGHELWFEGARRTDLIRHGKYIEYARKYRGSVTAQDYMNLMPLPQSIINESKGTVIQNPGY